MNIITNEKMIKRNSRTGQIASIVGLVILVGGMFVTFTYPNLVLIAWGALALGFILSQLGLSFANRYGRRPRPDEHLNTALKGLDDRFSIYHYTTSVPHLLVGPAGVWVLSPYHQIGKIVYEKNRWRQKGGGFFQGYLRWFAQEGLGRPDLEVPSTVSRLHKQLSAHLSETDMPEIRAALVFTSERAELETDNSPIPTLPAKKLKEFIRKSTKESGLAPLKVTLIQDALKVDE